LNVLESDTIAQISIPIDFTTDPFKCIDCRGIFSSNKLKDQIDNYFKEEYFRVKLTSEVRERLVNAIQPWFDKFMSRVDICFDCEIKEY